MVDSPVVFSYLSGVYSIVDSLVGFIYCAVVLEERLPDSVNTVTVMVYTVSALTSELISSLPHD